MNRTQTFEKKPFDPDEWQKLEEDLLPNRKLGLQFDFSLQAEGNLPLLD